MVQDKMMILSS